MLKAHEARELMPQNRVNEQIEAIETRIKANAKEGASEMFWRGIGSDWADKIQAYMYYPKKQPEDTALVKSVIETLESNGYKVKEFEEYSSLTDLGFKISWA